MAAIANFDDGKFRSERAERRAEPIRPPDPRIKTRRESGENESGEVKISSGRTNSEATKKKRKIKK